MATDLINIDIDPMQVFSQGGGDILLKQIQEFVTSLDRDGTTVTGRDNIRSVARKIASTKTAIDKRGKEVKDEWKKKCDVIDAERRKIWDGLEKLHDEYRAPLTEFENIEKERVARHEAKIEKIKCMMITSGPSDVIKQAIQIIENEYYDYNFEDFKKIADEAFNTVKAELDKKLAVALKSEADERELAALRKEQEERQRQEREDQIKRDAEERMRAEMEAKAARERAELEDRAKKAEEAANRAALAERERIEEEKKREIEDAARREADINHKKEINNQAADDIQKAIAGQPFEDFGRIIVRSIALGQIRNVKINY